ncbi:MAG: nucleotide sugar dehydrogenase [Alphaproteobacteria bacterium]|nr:nucleotide sugar dehydrogenase [Alphaproteobacteria bacterium]
MHKKTRRHLSVTGLGYVGLPLAVAFGRKDFSVVAFDIDRKRIEEIKQGIDRSHEVEKEQLLQAKLALTFDHRDLAKADFHIITVPTPINDAYRPDLGPVLSATKTLAGYLRKGDIVVYESTVYPGLTEEECQPVLEKISGLKAGQDFGLAYSPERVNPGDREHRFENIKKIVSASDPKTLDIVADTYGQVVTAGVYRAINIKTAEAAKVLENTQRDINIALMNELALICHRVGIDTQDVLTAAGTKWNFLKFTPGLVGGHCISVDPYYLTHKAEQLGYIPEVILAGRRVNNSIGRFVATEIIKHLTRHAWLKKPVITVLGLAFKENVPDIRNSKVVDIIHELYSYGVEVQIADPYADPAAVTHEYNLHLTPFDKLKPSAAVVLAVAHQAYRQQGWDMITSLLEGGKGFVADVKGILDRTQQPSHITLWRL